MKRKPKARKVPGPRNPLVAVAHFKRAGSHSKSNKALRRQEKFHMGGVVQVEEHSAFTRDVRFRYRRPHHEISFQSATASECVLHTSVAQ